MYIEIIFLGPPYMYNFKLIDSQQTYNLHQHNQHNQIIIIPLVLILINLSHFHTNNCNKKW